MLVIKYSSLLVADELGWLLGPKRAVSSFIPTQSTASLAQVRQVSVVLVFGFFWVLLFFPQPLERMMTHS